MVVPPVGRAVLDRGPELELDAELVAASAARGIVP
jgi:hypothetical protein